MRKIGVLFKLAIAILAIQPAISNAANWQLATISDAGDKFYIDGTSVIEVGKYRKAWLMTTLHAEDKTDSYPQKSYMSSKSLQYFDCKHRTNTSVQRLRYSGVDGNGISVESASVKFKPDQLEEVVPDTVGETLLRMVCGTATQRAAQHRALINE